MKRLIVSAAVALLALTVTAQSLPSSGYYRVQSAKSNRYITMIDAYGSLNISAADADMGALRTYPYSDDYVVSNPASVIYVDKRPDATDKYDLQSQGTGAYAIVGHVLQLVTFSDGTYGAYASMSGIAKYLSEGDSDFDVDFGIVKAQNYSATNKGLRWNVLPLSTSDATNYFGIKPDVQIGSDWYKAFYADFNFAFASSDMEAFYVTKVDIEKGMAVYQKIEGNVPRATPIYVKCSSDKPTNNRLNILTSTVSAISGNQLSGVYFSNTPNGAFYSSAKHVDCIEYDENTMRVLGKTSNGSLGFIKAPDASLIVEQNGKPKATHKYLPHNIAYLKVAANAPAELKLVTQKEYEESLVVNVTVTADNVTRAYGDANPTFTYTATGTFNGTPELMCEATATSPVGTYPITVSQGTVTGATIIGVAGTLTITAAPLKVKADDKSRLEGTDNPEFTVTYTGFKNGETATVLDAQPTVSTTATKDSAPGTYPITVSGGSAKNYTLSYENGTLTVTEGSLKLTARNYTREYGEENPAFEYDQSGTSKMRGTPAISCEATKTSPVGTYPIVITKGTIENGTVEYVNGTLTITAAPLKVKADDKSRLEGTDNPELTVTYTGFKNGETAAVLDEQPTVSTIATKDSAPGIYPITVSGGKAKNYTLSYEDGTLTVAEGSLLLTARSYTREYGEENPVFEYDQSGTTTLKGTPAISCEATKTSPAGTYTIVITKGTVENGSVTYVNGTLTITKAKLTVKANDANRLEGEPNPEFTLTYSGFKNNETEEVLTAKLTATTTANEQSKPGQYPIVVTSEGQDKNYEFNCVNGTLIVEAKPLIIKVDDEENDNTETLIIDEENGTATFTSVESQEGGSNVEKVEIPETVSNDGEDYVVNEIAESAFENMTTIETVVIPSTVEKIGANAFKGCTGLTSLIVYNEEPINLTAAAASRGMNGTTGDDTDPVFSGVNKDVCILYVPLGCKPKYEAAPVWNTFKNIQEMDEQGIADIIFKAGTSSDVYSVSGIKVRSGADSLKNLPAGIYVVGGKKIMVK